MLMVYLKKIIAMLFGCFQIIRAHLGIKGVLIRCQMNYSTLQLTQFKQILMRLCISSYNNT